MHQLQHLDSSGVYSAALVSIDCIVPVLSDDTGSMRLLFNEGPPALRLQRIGVSVFSSVDACCTWTCLGIIVAWVGDTDRIVRPILVVLCPIVRHLRVVILHRPTDWFLAV